MSKTNRRDFLIKSAPLVAAPFFLPVLSHSLMAGTALPHPAAAPASDMQADWRYCEKCKSLFFDGFPQKGRCAAGGGHKAEGLVFQLPYGLPEIPKAQTNWRYCDKCEVMFFDGFPDKGRCPGGGGHNARGFVFRLPHDVAADGNNQNQWRYCGKCHGMFYDGYPSKGACPAGAGHSAAGFGFVLPHDLQQDYHVGARLNTDGWAPISGNMDIVAKPNGDYVFSGHMHNAGGLNIRYSLAATVVTPSGQSFGFGVHGHRIDGTETVFGRNRDHNWNDAKNDPRIAKNFAQLQRSTLNWRLVATATITETIQNYVQNLGKETFLKMIQAANATPGAKLANFYMNFLIAL